MLLHISRANLASQAHSCKSHLRAGWQMISMQGSIKARILELGCHSLCTAKAIKIGLALYTMRPSTGAVWPWSTQLSASMLWQSNIPLSSQIRGTAQVLAVQTPQMIMSAHNWQDFAGVQPCGSLDRDESRVRGPSNCSGGNWQVKLCHSRIWHFSQQTVCSPCARSSSNKCYLTWLQVVPRLLIVFVYISYPAGFLNVLGTLVRPVEETYKSTNRGFCSNIKHYCGYEWC